MKTSRAMITAAEVTMMDASIAVAGMDADTTNIVLEARLTPPELVV